jgi:aryl-alcohol dehydrogenase-like predicted oxidoreductase
MVHVLRAAGIPVVASFVLAGGALTGKYRSGSDRSEAARGGRVAARLDDPSLRPALSAGERLHALAAEVGTTPAAMAIAYTLSNPDVASVLFGATSPAQLLQNAAAPALLSSMDADLLARLRQIGS